MVVEFALDARELVARLSTGFLEEEELLPLVGIFVFFSSLGRGTGFGFTGMLCSSCFLEG